MMTAQLTNSVTDSLTPASMSARLICVEKEQCVQLKIMPIDVPAHLVTSLTHPLKFDAVSSRMEKSVSLDNVS